MALPTRDLDNSFSLFDGVTKEPEIYLQSQKANADKFKSITKLLYDNVLKFSPANSTTNIFPRLYVHNFDEEQIWQQLELQNNSSFVDLAKIVSKIDGDVVKLGIGVHEQIPEENNFENNVSEEEGSSADEEYAYDDDSDSSDIPNETALQVECNKKSKPRPKKIKKSNFKSEVDDQFFKLSKLEHFLKLEDLKEENENEQQSDDEDIDLFQDIPSDDDEAHDDDEEEDDEVEEEVEKKSQKSAKDVMYEDFFDPPESGDESIMDEGSDEEREGNAKIDDEYYDIRDYDPEEGDSKSDQDNEENPEEEDVAKESKNVKSTEKTPFELEQEKVKKKIKECEKSMLEPLPWHLTGEVSAFKRPVDSLLDQQTDFDSNAKQELVVDNDLTERTESIIRTAIINKAWNDVERKVKPTEEQIAYRKEVVIEQTKSKKSLAQVYEEDFLKQCKKKDQEEENPKHIEIKKFMDSLFPELHALFSHIPKPAVPEIKVVNNLPAITVEEVAPTAVSDATLLAPEEVKKKSGAIKGKTERTDTDRKRERRKKKLHQKLKQKKREKQENLSENPKSARTKKKEKLQTLKKLKQHRNTKIGEVDTEGKIKSSKDFFSRLQDTVEAKVPKVKNKINKSKKSKK